MERFDVAAEIIQEAGKILRRCHLEQREIIQKTDHQDLVTFWDRKIEQQLRHSILTAFPQDSIVGEEYPPQGTVTGKLPGIWTPLTGQPILSTNARTTQSPWGAGKVPTRCSAWCWMWNVRHSTGQSMETAHGRIRRRSIPPAGGSFRNCC